MKGRECPRLSPMTLHSLTVSQQRKKKRERERGLDIKMNGQLEATVIVDELTSIGKSSKCWVRKEQFLSQILVNKRRLASTLIYA